MTDEGCDVNPITDWKHDEPVEALVERVRQRIDFPRDHWATDAHDALTELAERVKAAEETAEYHQREAAKQFGFVRELTARAEAAEREAGIYYQETQRAIQVREMQRDELVEALEREAAACEEAGRRWRERAAEERREGSVSDMCGERLPSHPITTARAMSYEGCAKSLRAALAKVRGEAE